MTEPPGRARIAREGGEIRIGWERWGALAGAAFVVLYVAAFSLGIEVGDSDSEILDYYADSGNRTKEAVAFFLIAGAALAFLLYATALRNLVAMVEEETRPLTALAWAGGAVAAALLLAGNAVSRATAFAAMTEGFEVVPDTREMLETAGFLLFVSAMLAAILLVVAVSLAALRYGVLPRWLAWAGFVTAALLPLAIAFVGYLVFLAWVLAVSAVLGFRRSPA